MQFARILTAAAPLIETYDAQHVRIAGRHYALGVRLCPDAPPTAWGPANPAALTAEQIALLLCSAPQVIVVGVGSQPYFPALPVYAAALTQRIGIEFMTTGAACRTYNLLVSDGRRVALGLLPG